MPLRFSPVNCCPGCRQPGDLDAACLSTCPDGVPSSLLATPSAVSTGTYLFEYDVFREDRIEANPFAPTYFFRVRKKHWRYYGIEDAINSSGVVLNRRPDFCSTYGAIVPSQIRTVEYYFQGYVDGGVAKYDVETEGPYSATLGTRLPHEYTTLETDLWTVLNLRLYDTGIYPSLLGISFRTDSPSTTETPWSFSGGSAVDSFPYYVAAWQNGTAFSSVPSWLNSETPSTHSTDYGCGQSHILRGPHEYESTGYEYGHGEIVTPHTIFGDGYFELSGTTIYHTPFQMLGIPEDLTWRITWP